MNKISSQGAASFSQQHRCGRQKAKNNRAPVSRFDARHARPKNDPGRRSGRHGTNAEAAHTG
jgi:hypothetical protein